MSSTGWTTGWTTGLLVGSCVAAAFIACGGATPEPTRAQPPATMGAEPTSEPTSGETAPLAGGDEGDEGAEGDEHHDGPLATPHPVEGREQCTSCHTASNKPSKATPMPPDHTGRDDKSCLGCHKPAHS